MLNKNNIYSEPSFSKEGSGRNSGFIALISSIIISAALIAVMLSLSYSSFFARFNILDSEYKERSSALADGCVDAALLELANNPSYSGGEDVAYGSVKCRKIKICPPDINCSVTPQINEKVIETQAVFQNAYTNLQVVVDEYDLDVISWKEVTNF